MDLNFTLSAILNQEPLLGVPRAASNDYILSGREDKKRAAL